jgi:putative effector of murein hydrolase LrgA (UPF0299 family)
MKTIFLLLELLTDGDAIRNVLHACFTAGVISVVVLFLLGVYQVVRRACTRRDSTSPSRA